MLDFARALAVSEPYLRQLVEAVRGHLAWVAMDMLRHNVRSIPGMRWQPDDPAAAFQPYRGSADDAALLRRYDALRALPVGTLGRAFWDHYHDHGYPLPGAVEALNERFATPHDSTHVLSGYSTSPQGELLVSTFTATMHEREAMAGHVLPVIFSWHLGIELNRVAGAFTGALDPEKLWVAWDRGAANVSLLRPSSIDIPRAVRLTVFESRRYRPRAASGRPRHPRASRAEEPRMDRSAVVIPKGMEPFFEQWHFAPAIRDGDRLWCAGVIGIGADGKASPDPTAQFTRAFELVGSVLETSGVGFGDVVDMTTFHVGLQAHLPAFAKVKDAFVRAPYPAWTAIGVTELAVPGGLVEIKVVARLAR